MKLGRALALVVMALALPAQAQTPPQAPAAVERKPAAPVTEVSPSPQQAGRLPYPVLKQGPASAASGTCKAIAATKKIAGRELADFLEGCKRQTIKGCEQIVSEKRLAVDARRAFMVKCVRDGTGL